MDWQNTITGDEEKSEEEEAGEMMPWLVALQKAAIVVENEAGSLFRTGIGVEAIMLLLTTPVCQSDNTKADRRK